MNFREFEELIEKGLGEITLTEDVIGQEDYEEGIEINTPDLIIDGNNHTIDANHLGRIFIINANNVTLKNIEFINGKTGGGGGAIINYGLNLVIISCSFKNNLTNGGRRMRIPGGGAIGSYADMSLCDCKFEGNTGFGDNGGAIYLERFDGPVEVVLKNCDFKNNNSDGANNDWGSNGGAIYNKNVNLRLYECRFKDNGLTGWGNFDYNETLFNDGELSMASCSFTSKDDGYCIFNTGKLIVKDADFNQKDLILNKGSLEIIR